MIKLTKSLEHYPDMIQVNKIFSHAFSSAGHPNILQPPGISRENGKRPGGMTLTPWSHGKSLIFDVTIRDMLAPSLIYVNLQNIQVL